MQNPRRSTPATPKRPPSPRPQTLESGSRARARRALISDALLASLAVVGIGAIALTAPNSLRLLKNLDPDWIRKRDPKQRLYEVASRLKRKGFVEFLQEDGRTRMRITEAGQAELRKAALRAAPNRPARWDKKWRLVIYDIRENRRPLRQQIRSILNRFGFVRLQNSVWVSPYDCEELITLLKTDLRIGTSLLYIIADAIEFDAPLRRRFNLPPR